MRVRLIVQPAVAMILAALIGSAILGAVLAAPAQKYGITVKADKHTDFRALHTYTWTPGPSSIDRALDRHIVAAVDAELAALGLVKRDAEPCDAIVTYRAMRRTDVDIGAWRHHSPTYSEYPVATLVIRMTQPVTGRELFRARAVAPVETDTAHLEPQIDTMVAEIFAGYPTRR